MEITGRRLTIAMSAAVALVLARAAVFLLWEQASFDADQAIFGLMAKHIAEGRAFPMFLYGDRYLLAVEAWLAAPLFAVLGPSVAVLKLPLVLVNVATAVLLVWVLHRDGGLKPVTALICSLFYVWASPALAESLVDAAGGNPEPFLYVLLLWVLRDRPLVFGVVFGIGFIHREFTAYGVTAIVGLALLDDWRVTTERLRAVALAGIGYMVVWQLVRTGFVFSNQFGPGAPIAIMCSRRRTHRGRSRCCRRSTRPSPLPGRHHRWRAADRSPSPRAAVPQCAISPPSPPPLPSSASAPG